MDKITLALGGGGTKGFTHIGVIRQLENEDCQISAIAGTSAGGIVSALYALGYSTQEIEQYAKKLVFSELFSRANDDAPSLLGLGGLYKVIDEVIADATFEDTKIDFATTAVDLESGQEIIFNHGSIANAVKATIAVPGVFPALRLGDLYLVDGGILDPVPVSVARWLNPDFPVFAVNLAPPMTQWSDSAKIDVPSSVPVPKFIVEQLNQLRLGKALHVFIDSFEIATNTIGELRLKMENPDVIINPAVHQYTMFDNVNIDELITLGEQAVVKAREKIKESFSVKSRVNRWFKTSRPPGRLISEIQGDSAGANERE